MWLVELPPKEEWKEGENDVEEELESGSKDGGGINLHRREVDKGE